MNGESVTSEIKQYMLLALNYPVGLHDLCLGSTAVSYFKPSHESPGAADHSVWRSPLW